MSTWDPFNPALALAQRELLLTRLVLHEPERADDGLLTTRPPGLAELWEAVCWWATQPSELSGDTDRDLLLFETSKPDRLFLSEETPWYRRRAHVLLGITRQFIPVASDGEDDEMQSVCVTMYFEPDPELLRLLRDSANHADRWWAGGPAATGWVSYVERAGMFQALLTRSPYALAVDATYI